MAHGKATGKESACILHASHSPSTILASTEELYQQNEKLGSRIRDLENALAALHASTSDIPHPLLAEDLLSLKVPPGIAVNKDEQEEIVDAFGTLHICEPFHLVQSFLTLSATDGSGLFYGTSAPSEMLMNDYEVRLVSSHGQD